MMDPHIEGIGKMDVEGNLKIRLGKEMICKRIFTIAVAFVNCTSSTIRYLNTGIFLGFMNNNPPLTLHRSYLLEILKQYSL